MTDDPVKQALAELHDLVRCRCHSAYTGRGLRDPDCECDSAEALKVVSDRIEELEAKLAGGSFYQEKDIDALQDRLAAQAAEIERLEKACDDWAEVSQSNYQRAKAAEAKLAKAVEALRFYAWENEIRLPSDGSWGAGSTDFGKFARATLSKLTGAKP